MGKRELLIALAFIVAGTIAFQFSAPPAKQATSGFSFSRLIDSAKREMRGNQTFTAPARSLTFAAGTDITEVRISGLSGPLKVVGDDRTDVTLNLIVTSTGENEAAAIEIANKTQVKDDHVGGVLSLQVVFPREESQTSQAVLSVPRRLAVRLDGNRETTISNVRAVDFTTPTRGTTNIDHVAERVSGEQSGGSLTLTSVAGVKMTLTRARARLSDLSGETSLDVRDGDTEISASRGALSIEERRGDITVRAHKGAVKVSGSDGQVRIDGATAEVHLDLRRAEVEAELAAGAVGSLVTSDEELRVSWIDPAGVVIDAVATNGSIDGADWSLTPTKSGNDTRVEAQLGAKTANAPRVSLRNQNANIVVKKSTKK